jgi:hypothetical protein
LKGILLNHDKLIIILRPISTVRTVNFRCVQDSGVTVSRIVELLNSANAPVVLNVRKSILKLNEYENQ